jgi:hypothetical protein
MDARPGLRVSLALAVALFVAPSAQAADPNFTIEPFPPTAGDPTRFTAETDSTSEADWDFDEADDFEVADDAVVEHVFAAAGAAQVRMRASDGTIVTKDFTVNAPPVAAFIFSAGTLTLGQGIVFTSESMDPEGDALEYRWDFGDGTFATEPSVEHAFTTPGTKSVQLTVTDPVGATRSVTRGVDVGVPAAPAVLLTDLSPADTTPAFMSPFPIVRLSGQVLRRATLIRLLAVRAPRGAIVRVRCIGRDCPARSARRRVRETGVVRFHGFERRLRPGTRLAVFVRRGDEIGKYTRFAMRAGERPLRTDRCLLPGGRRPARCPD